MQNRAKRGAAWGAHAPPRAGFGALAEAFRATNRLVKIRARRAWHHWPARAPASTREGAYAPRAKTAARPDVLHSHDHGAANLVCGLRALMIGARNFAVSSAMTL